MPHLTRIKEMDRVGFEPTTSAKLLMQLSTCNLKGNY
jgi:hypothetical protein